MRNRLSGDDGGNVILLVALMLVVIFGMASLAIDIGVLYVDRQHTQGASDAGALAGADQLLKGTDAAVATAQNMALANNGEAKYQVTADSVADTVTVQGTETVPLWFARILGSDTGTVHVRSEARIGTLTSAVGIVPIAVANQAFSYGTEYFLSDGAGQGQSGNYGFLDFSGQGAHGVEYDIENGYDFPLTVGQQVATKPGVMAGPVSTAVNYRMTEAEGVPGSDSFQTVQPDSPRVMYLPVVDTLDVSGKKDVTILGFAAFYLEVIVGNGGHQQIQGRFIQMVRPGTIGVGQNYGTYGVKLTN